MPDPEQDSGSREPKAQIEPESQHVPESAPTPTAHPAEEPTPMLDVHPAHRAASTWKEFFIHIATICLGLLIAIGLENAVEAVHHSRERRVLIAGMRAESEQNVVILQRDVASQLDLADMLLAQMKALEQAKPHAGVITVALPAHAPIRGNASPDGAVWAIAQTNGNAALLSETAAEVYYRLEIEAELAREFQQRGFDAQAALDDEEVRLHTHLTSGTTIALPAADLPDLLKVLAALVRAVDHDAERDAYWEGAADGVAHGVETRAGLFPYMEKARAAINDRLYIE
jgi:hypothetical protein